MQGFWTRIRHRQKCRVLSFHGRFYNWGLSAANQERSRHQVTKNGFQKVYILCLEGAKVKKYAIPGKGDEFCFSVSFFSDNFATPLKEITLKPDRDYGR